MSSAINENRLHADPEIQGTTPQSGRSAPVRDADAARPRGDDLREVQGGPARVRRARARRPETTDGLLPDNFRRSEPPKLPEIAEPEIVRHYNRLSKRNFDLDTGFYPLGSCTMKHNPKLHERVAALPGNARLHPAQDPKRAQGALQLMYELQQALGEIAGLPHVASSRAPARTASSPACC